MKEIKDYKVGDKVLILYNCERMGQIGEVVASYTRDRIAGPEPYTFLKGDFSLPVKFEDGGYDSFSLLTSIKPANTHLIKERLGIK